MPIENEASHQENEYLSSAESQFAEYIKGRDQAIELLKPVLDSAKAGSIAPENRKQIIEAFNALGRAGYSQFIESVSDERRREIEMRISPNLTESLPE